MSKNQDEKQLKGRWGELLAALAFPPHWVVRPLPHDFGIDLQVEIFRDLGESAPGARYQSTGAHLSFQVKTSDLAMAPGATTVAFPADVADLRLAESMGSGAPLVLLYVHRPSRLIYFVCVTDYLSKVLDNSNPGWRNQSTATVHVPTRNVLDLDRTHELVAQWAYLRGLAYRSKLFAELTMWSVRQQRLNRAEDDLRARAPLSAEDFARFAGHHRDVVQSVTSPPRADIWDDDSPYFGLLRMPREAIARLRSAFQAFTDAELEPAAITSLSPSEFERLHDRYMDLVDQNVGALDVFGAIGRTYEEVHRLAGLQPQATPIDIVV